MLRKVTDEDVDEMKSLRKDGLTYKEIAEKFEVSSSTVSRYLKDVEKGSKDQKTPEEEEESEQMKKSVHEEEEKKTDRSQIGTEKLSEIGVLEEEEELSTEIKQRIINFNEVGMSIEEIATRLELPYSKVRDCLEEESLGILDKLKRKLGM